MNLTNSERVWKLLGAHLTQPQWFLPWVRDNLILRRSPIELGRPWISYSATAWLRKNLRPTMRVFEYGSGGSTLFFAKRVAQVVSVEDDADWRGVVEQRVRELGLANVEIRHRAFDFRRTENFAASDYVNTVRDGAPWDVIVVDGQDWTNYERPVCFAIAQECLVPGGFIVVDDSWRYTQLRTTSKAREVRVFESVGPGRLGVTSTDIYFY